MGCGCKNKGNAVQPAQVQAQQQAQQAAAQERSQQVQEAIQKTVAKYYNVNKSKPQQ